MKILKFGGTSVGTAESIGNVKRIVEATEHPVIVVVSALGGVTDRLIALSRMAAGGDEGWRGGVDELQQRHHDMARAVVPQQRRPGLLAAIDGLTDELRSILHGVCLIQDLTPKTADAIVSYGERLSSLLCTALFDENPDKTVMVVLADKEEIGSVGNTGLASEFLNYFVADLAAAEDLEARHVYSQSTCLSADVTAAYDPTYASAFEAGNSCYLNRGVGVAKYTGSRGKGGSNDANAEFVGQVRRIFEDNDVLWQIGELGKVDQGGGGTVALDISRMNADVIDVGVPVLSMHSPFELVSKLDVYMAFKAFKSYFEAE